jgi:hypothetical protein
MSQTHYYTREVDDGQGAQVLVVKDGKVISQSISSKPGLHHSYTGDGNPEVVGQNIKDLRGWGFRKDRREYNPEDEVMDDGTQY